MKKRLLSLLLAAILLLGISPVFAARMFLDVPEDCWYADAVKEFTREGYVRGVSDTRFEPGGTMTRAMVVTILSRMGGGLTPNDKTKTFTDVNSDSWYSAPIAWAVQNDIARGMNDGTFAPNTPITREQMAVFLWRYMCMRYEFDHDKFFAEQAFSASDPVSGWAQEAVRMMIGSGIMKGRAQSGDAVRFDARAACTRAEAVTMLWRMVQLELPDQEPADTDPTPEPPETTMEPLDAMAESSLRLLQASHKDGKNTVVSPLSMLYALDLLAEGSGGETLQELERFFGMPVKDATGLLGNYLSSMDDGKSKIKCANSVWVNETCSLLPDYASRVQASLKAEVRSRAFNDATVKELNDWVSDQTDGLISGVLDRLDPDDMLVLMNALLFKGQWGEVYPNTTDRVFRAADGNEQKVPMLASTEYTYLSGKDVIGFRKPFSGGRYSFAVLVPQADNTPEKLIRSLDGASLRQLLKGEEYDEVHAFMPKFKAETQLDLLPVLSEVGIQNMDDLSRISNESLAVSRGLHKAVIDVNESGVSAAAVTAIIADKAVFPDPNRKIATVVADRPYVYMIVDNESLLPLFAGVYSRPSK